MKLEKLCPECCSKTKDDMEFCSKCGANLQIRCPACKEGIRWSCEYCPKCGIKLSNKVNTRSKCEHRKSWLIKHWWIVAACLLLAFAGTGTIVYINSDSYAYRQAGKLRECNKLEEAIAVYSDLGEYRDSQELILETRYEIAENLQENGNLQAATLAFENLANYKDSRDRFSQIQYEIAEELYEAGDFEEAAAAFAELRDYSDSQERSFTIRYEIVNGLLENGDTEAADSILYVIAQDFYDIGDIESAAIAFSNLGDYLDARERHFSISYEMAAGYYESGDLENALIIFIALGNYRDSRRRATEVRFPTNGDVITDMITDLQWRVGPDRATSRSEAEQWVNELGDRWRLPSQNELWELYDAGVVYRDWGPFENRGYWVYSEDARQLNSFGSSWLAWGFNFEGGRGWFAYDGASGFGRTFAVRSSSSGD